MVCSIIFLHNFIYSINPLCISLPKTDSLRIFLSISFQIWANTAYLEEYLTQTLIFFLFKNSVKIWFTNSFPSSVSINQKMWKIFTKKLQDSIWAMKNIKNCREAWKDEDYNCIHIERSKNQMKVVLLFITKTKTFL